MIGPLEAAGQIFFPDGRRAAEFTESGELSNYETGNTQTALQRSAFQSPGLPGSDVRTG